MQALIDQIKPGDMWRHYKNKDYRILSVSCHSEDLSWYVVYEALYDNPVSKIWHRPLEMFLGTVDIDGVIIPRFTHIQQSHINKNIQQNSKEIILQKGNDVYAAIKKDPKQRLEYEEELSLWESTLEDGLKNK